MAPPVAFSLPAGGVTDEPALRILMLAQFYSPIIGGEERMVQDLSQELARRGHSVAVTTLWHSGLSEFEMDGPVRVYRIHGLMERATWIFKESGRRHAPPWPDLGLAKGLRAVIRRERPQVVHAHNWMVHSFLPLKRWSGARLVVSLHDYSLVCAKKRLIYQNQACAGPGLVKCMRCAAAHYGPVKGVPTAFFNTLATQWERPAVDMFLPVSRAVAEQCQLDGHGAHYQVIPNFVNSDLPGPKIDTAPFVGQLPAGDFLLFVGDLSMDKGIQVLLDAYAAIPAAPPLVLIGRRCADTPAAFPPNVLFLNSWPHAAVIEAWRRGLIGLVPSVCPEAFGLVALEAMAAGRPVIASHIGGLADVVLDGQTGLLVPPGDAAALRTAIQRLLQDRELCGQMGGAAKRRAGEFGAGTVVPQVEQVYRALLASPASSMTNRGQPALARDRR